MPRAKDCRQRPQRVVDADPDDDFFPVHVHCLAPNGNEVGSVGEGKSVNDLPNDQRKVPVSAGGRYDYSDRAGLDLFWWRRAARKTPALDSTTRICDVSAALGRVELFRGQDLFPGDARP
jgi:hypothetical protein